MGRKAKDAGEAADKLIQDLSAQRSGQVDDGGGGDDVVTDQLNLDDDGGSDDELLDILNSDSNNTKDDDGWEHKYEVLQGKYNAEIPRMNQMLSEALSRVAALEEENKSLKGGKKSPTPNQSDDSVDYDEELEKIKEQYPSLYKGLLAAVRSETSKLVKEATKITEARVDDIATKNLQRDQESYLTELTKLVPRWRDINSHPAFLRWLTVKDKFSGRPKSELLLEAYNRMDAQTTSEFFNDFLEEKGVRSQTVKPIQEDLAPGDSGTRVTVKKGSVGTITQAEINKFYQDRAMGRFQGTEEDAAKFERRIFQAVRENKVR